MEILGINKIDRTTDEGLRLVILHQNDDPTPAMFGRLQALAEAWPCNGDWELRHSSEGYVSVGGSWQRPGETWNTWHQVILHKGDVKGALEAMHTLTMALEHTNPRL